MTRHLDPILIADDDPDDSTLILDSLKTARVARPVQTVANGREAIDYLSGKGQYSDRARFPMPCLVLLDIKMPLADGFEVLEWIRSTAKMVKLPVLMLTGSAQPHDIDRAFSLGANAFLVKPLRMERMAEMMEAIKHFWLEFNQSSQTSSVTY